jgi:opacity protein-like surface antigen
MPTMQWIFSRSAITLLLIASCSSAFSANAQKIDHDKAVLNSSSFPQTQMNHPDFKGVIAASSPRTNWFLSAGGGIQFPMLDSKISVSNSNSLPSPYNHDLYYSREDDQGVVSASAGYRWETANQWLSAYSAGLSYQYFFKNNSGCCVVRNATPDYRYKWDISSNVLLAFAKVNIFQYTMGSGHYNNISPYINVGVGAAFNRSNAYSESVLSGAATRISPAFADNTSSQFAYNAGAGVDVQLTSQFILSLAYEYMNLGRVRSGHGSGTWANQSLNLNSYQSNEVLLNLIYLI